MLYDKIIGIGYLADSLLIEDTLAIYMFVHVFVLVKSERWTVTPKRG